MPDYPPLPKRLSVGGLRESAKACRACDLWARATQTVFGEGRPSARVVFIGEQPGDREDLSGKPFVGPAGGILDRALAEAGIDRADAYVTNVVKHFKWRAAGKKRIHQKPNAAEIAACRFWLELEIRTLKPELLVLLGATAAQSILGRAFRVTRDRGKVLPTPLGPKALATIHPSAILRAEDDASRRREYAAFVSDLTAASRQLRRS